MVVEPGAGRVQKHELLRPGDAAKEEGQEAEILDVADYQPLRVPSKRWRQLMDRADRHEIGAFHDAPEMPDLCPREIRSLTT